MRILGVDIDERKQEDIHRSVEWFLENEEFHRIATVNPEFLVKASEDGVFRENLSSADLRVADGFGIVLVGFLRGKRLFRYPGADLMTRVLAEAERRGFGIFLAIRKDGLSSYEDIKNALLKKYPELVIGGAEFDLHQAPIYKIPNTQYQILLCNFGVPEQEFFVESFREHSGSIQVAVGVGGTFDFFTGKRKRAPKWLRAIGLEWLWRLATQPEKVRFLRVWRATGVFLWKTLFFR